MFDIIDFGFYKICVQKTHNGSNYQAVDPPKYILRDTNNK